MKICFLSDANSIHTKKLCTFFKDKGHDVYVISLNEGFIPGAKVYSFDVSLDKLRSKNDFKKLEYLTYRKKVKKLKKEINPDIVNAHYATSYGLLGALSDFHPYVLSVWGSDVFDFPKKNIISKMLLKYNLSKADRILSTSSVMAEETRLYTEKPVYVTPFGVDINVFKPEENVEKYNREELIIGTIKTLEPKYGIEYLIRAFAKVAENNTNVRLEIAGRGSQKEYLVNLCKELNVDQKVKFLGFLDREEVVKTFNNFDIAVFPSTLDSESFGVAAVEAQACGVPVIVSNVGGLPEATCPNVSSLLVQKENIDELKIALEKLVNDKELRMSMGKSGRKFVEENYNIENNFNEINKIYNELLS